MNTKELTKAIELAKDGKFQEAEIIYNELLSKNPEDCTLLSAVGLFYVNINNYEKAVEYFKRASKVKETFGTAAAWGLAEFERKNFYEASRIFRHALKLGSNADIYNKLILSLFEIHDFKKAHEYTDKMCELYPDNQKSIANKVKVLTKEGKLYDAEILCVNYLKKNPNDGLLWYHLGLLKELIHSDDNQAIECYKIAGQFGYSGADYNIGVAYQKLGNYEQAEIYYKKFIENKPHSDECKVALGLCYLAQKKFHEGYELLYNRKKGNISKYTGNLWKPKTHIEKDIVIIGDQGFGDNIQFVRYLPLLENHSVTLAVSEQLKTLFTKNYPNVNVISKNEINPEVQAIRITDLAYALDLDFNNIPYASGYLKSDTADIKTDKIKVGLCWEAGSAGIRNMINRTINVKYFEPILNLKNIQAYSFQYNDSFEGCETYTQMINLAKDFKDFYDTACALKAMDVVITVDTAVAHLAGALGVKTCLLLPYSSDWRWFNDTQTTPWYNSIQIYKQKTPVRWDDIISEIISSLNLG